MGQTVQEYYFDVEIVVKMYVLLMVLSDYTGKITEIDKITK